MTDDNRLLLQRVLAGEDEAYAETVRRFQQSVWGVVAAMLFDRNEAEEVMQEVFVSAYMHLDQFDLGGDFGAWLRQIARNCVRKRARTASRRSRHLALYRESLQEAYSDAARADAQQHSAMLALEECRQQLPDRWATAVTWRYEDGCSFDEIAERLETSRAATEKLISRARASLRDCLRAKLNPE